MIPTYDQALEILKKYNEDEFHIKHGKTVAHVMRYMAGKYDPENVDYWEIVGLIHDLDYGLYPEEHCVKQVELMRSEGIDESIIKSTISHGYGLVQNEVKPEKEMEKILYATDELTGLIGAASLMRPSKSTLDMNLKSVKKKFKDKKFAAGCSRDVISNGADLLGWDLDRLLSETLEAMQDMERA